MEQPGSVPVLRSTFDPRALRGQVESAYELELSDLRLIKAVILDSYRVTADKGSFILRIYPARRRTLEAIRGELDFLGFLGERGMPVSVPIPSKSGRRTLTLRAPEGVRHVVLFSYAAGEPLDSEPATMRDFGSLLARLHRAADAFRPIRPRAPLDLDFLLERPLSQLDRVAERPGEWADLHRIARAIRPVLETLPRAAPVFGYIHGDGSCRNAHRSARGRITLFDFDFCGPGWRVYDVATILSSEPAEGAAAFLEGYQTLRRLSDDERAAIPLLQISQHIWMLGTRASYRDEWGEIHFSAPFIQRVRQGIHATFDAYSHLAP